MSIPDRPWPVSKEVSANDYQEAAWLKGPAEGNRVTNGRQIFRCNRADVAQEPTDRPWPCGARV
jgi:hypothetical protein